MTSPRTPLPKAPSPSTSLQGAKAWLRALDGAHSSPSNIQRSISSGPINNRSITVGALRARLPLWRWAHSLLQSDSSARSLQIVDKGYRLPFIPGSPVPVSTTDTIRRNYVTPSHPEGPWVARQLDLMLASGALRKHDPDTHRGAFFSSPLFVVPKAQGTGLRLIVDMREINSHLRPQPFSLAPAMLQHNRDLFRKGNGLFVIDFTSSFQHVQIHPDHLRFFGIVWAGHRYVMTVAPYGCSTVPEMFQTVAGVTRDVALRVGLSPDLTSPDAWRDAITLDAKGPAGSSFDPARHFTLETRQYLDDKYGCTVEHLVSRDGTTHNAADSAQINLLLIRSLAALDAAFGWAISPKSHLIPSDPNNTVLGFHVRFHPTAGASFHIPASKVARYSASLRALSTRPTWTAHHVATTLGQINHLSLVWRDLTAIVSRPLYDFVANHNWWKPASPLPRQRDAVILALESLIGPKARTSCHVYPRDMELAEHLDRSSFTSANLPEHASLIFTDASDHAVGMFLTDGPRCKALRARREALYAFGRGSLARWRMMLEPDFNESSTYRELLAVLYAYSSGVLNRLLKSTTPLIHHVDSQAAWYIIRSGSSRSHRCHDLAVQIWRRLIPLRAVRPVVFTWIPRDQNQAADHASKGVHDYRIDPEIFLAIDSVLHFNLDLFASQCEQVVGHSGPVPFASLFQSDESLGNGLHVTMKTTDSIWAFPPSPLIHLAIKRCRECSAVCALLTPLWRPHSSAPKATSAVTRADSFGHKTFTLRIPEGFASRRMQSLGDAGELRTETCRHAFSLTLFNTSRKAADKIQSLLRAIYIRRQPHSLQRRQ